ncbi:hypothetical protein CL614_06790 [archaeon]|nr:hypothetical protein [archaeon]
MFSSPFGEEESTGPDLEGCDIVFVADFFAEDYPGGAELTTEVLIDSCNGLKVEKLRSSEVTKETLGRALDKYWIFANFTALNGELIPAIIANIKYSIVEYDFKYCKFRSPEKHKFETGEDCDCQNQMNGKIVSAFMFGADSLLWMSERQKNHYHDLFPFLARKKNVTVSSVFSTDFYKHVSAISSQDSERTDNYLIIDSPSWIKGVEDAVAYCEDNDLQYEKVSGLSHQMMLDKFSTSKGLVFLPPGGDTCPRVVIEAKLLGCELIINENVMHQDEEWFNTENIQDTVEWLLGGPDRFWGAIYEHLNRLPTISGYTTTYNCIDQSYPFVESISSMLGFCDQIVVIDGGSTDGTWEELQTLAAVQGDGRIVIHRQERDWNHKRFAVFDGLQKALARSMCTSEFCWQQDSDEIVHEKDYEKIKTLARTLPKQMDLVALPVIEFWGKKNKVRVDVNPWKWRFSRNRPHITHGVPAHLRVFDDEGMMFSKPGTDGCDYIRSDSFEPVQFNNFYGKEHHDLRMSALNGSTEDLKAYAMWLMSVCSSLPSVIHYSWYDLSRKIKTYRGYWSRHWQSLYNIEQDDTAENNMFFDKPWSEVSDKEIDELSSKLDEEMGGWIFHKKIDFEQKTPFLQVDESIHPDIIKGWLK